MILRAARLLKGRGVRSRLIGPVRRKYAELLDRLALDNTEMVDAVPYERLPVEIAKADLCLGGHFSDRDKAKRVIAGETFQFLSCRKPTLVGDKPANQDLFVEGDLVHFVEMNSPEALASKIAELTQEPTRGISSQGQCASKAPY